MKLGKYTILLFIFALLLPNFTRANSKNAMSIKSLHPSSSFMLLDLATNINQGGDRFLYGPGVEAGLFFKLWSSKRYHTNNVHHVSFGMRASYHYGFIDRQIEETYGVKVEARFYTMQALLRYMSPSTNDNLYSFMEAGYAYAVAQYNSEITEESMRTIGFFPGNVDHLFKGTLGLGYSFEEYFKIYVAASVMANIAHVEGFGSLGLTLGI